jgi:hypothetical protein
MFRNRLGFGLLAALTMSIVLVRAHPEGPGAIEAYLHGLAEGGAITEAQHVHIERLYAKSQLSQLGAWLDAQEMPGGSRPTHVSTSKPSSGSARSI